MQKDHFDIKETVNRNIEKWQTPNFGQHRSLVGWCSMNYPKILTNPLYLPKPVQKDYQYDLSHIYQHSNKPQTQLKPFSGQPSDKPKPTSLTLSTAPYQVRAQVFQQTNAKVQPFSTVKPMRCILGPNKDHQFQRKIRKIGQITYNPQQENEDMRHLKRLPNWVLTQQNLMQILGTQLKQLNLQNNYWVTNDLLNKIGYFSPNIQVLDCSYTNCNDDSLIQLGKSAKVLKKINISNSKYITSKGLKRFLELCTTLQTLYCCHNQFVDDQSLIGLNKLNVNRLALSFTNISSITIDSLAAQSLKYKQIIFSSCPNIKADGIIKLIDKSYQVLEVLDLSFNDRQGFNNSLMIKIGCCPNLKEITLTGCSAITDQGIANLINGQRKQGKMTKPDGFKYLQTVKFGGLEKVGDYLYHLFKIAPNIKLLELNSLEKLTDSFMQHVKSMPKIQVVLLNFTTGITEQKIEEMRENHKHIKIVRNILKITDPKDDGLRMPYPPAGLKKKKRKRKKKMKMKMKIYQFIKFLNLSSICQ